MAFFLFRIIQSGFSGIDISVRRRLTHTTLIIPLIIRRCFINFFLSKIDFSDFVLKDSCLHSLENFKGIIIDSFPGFYITNHFALFSKNKSTKPLCRMHSLQSGFMLL